MHAAISNLSISNTVGRNRFSEDMNYINSIIAMNKLKKLNTKLWYSTRNKSKCGTQRKNKL